MKRNYHSPEAALNDLKKRGYDADFTIDTSCLYCGDLDIRLDPEEFKVDEEYRFPGDPNHEEDIVVVAITSYSGVKGVLVDGHGSYTENASPEKTNQHFLQSTFQTILFILLNITVMAQTGNPLKAENDPRIFKQVRSFLNALNSADGKPMEKLNPVEARSVLTNAQNSVTVDYSGIEESERTIVHDGANVNLHITKPIGVGSNAPVFLFIHGGGWVLGDYPTHRRLVRDLVVASGAVAVFPDYAPSPESRYPVAVYQIYAALKWVAENGNEIGVDGKNLAVVGNSVGGNMTAAVVLLAKQMNGPAIKLQVLLWPVTNANFETGSYKELGEGRFLTRNMMIWFWDNYLPDKNKRLEIYASPLLATLEQLKGLPPALVQTAENDVLRDEGEAYARKLDEAGVPVTLTRYGGLIHDYGLLNPLAEVPAVKIALLQAAAAIRKTLSE